MTIDTNPAARTATDLPHRLGDGLLNLAIAIERGVGYRDPSDLLDELLTGIETLAFGDVYLVAVGRVFTPRDVCAVKMLDDVQILLADTLADYDGQIQHGNTTDGHLLRGLLGDVFGISVTCLTWGGAR